MTARPSPIDVEQVLISGADTASARQRRGQLLSTSLSTTVTVCWIVFVLLFDHWDRVVDNWASAITMVFGSFVAGSTPQGGGVVAFPVFTKVLGVPGSVARLFSLSIQTVGMGCASLSILFYRRQVSWQGIAWVTPSAVAGFLATVLFWSNSSAPFRPPVLPGEYVKVLFTVVLASMAVGLWLQYRPAVIELRTRLQEPGIRMKTAFVLFGLLGGITSALVGSGADVFAYIVLVLVAGVSPRVGVPSSVIIMAVVSVIGFISLAIIDLQLATDISGSTVTRVSEQPVSIGSGELQFGATGSPATTSIDAYGLWLAAVPIVAWGAPLGAWVSSKLSDRLLVRFVVGLALAEVISTIVFLSELRTDRSLQLFAAVLSLVLIGGMWVMVRARVKLVGTPEFKSDQVIVPQNVDVRPDFSKSFNIQEADDDTES